MLAVEQNILIFFGSISRLIIKMENTTLVSKGSWDFGGTFLLQVMDVKDALCDADNPTVATVRVVNRLFQLGVKMNHLHSSLSLTNRLSKRG